MAIKHIEIQYDGNVSQSSLDELYIAKGNLDATSKVEGNITLNGYTPMVCDALEENFSGLHITRNGKKYIEIDPKYRVIQKEFSKYSDDNSGYVSEEAAAKVTSVSINTAAAEIWDMTGWFDKFEKITNLPFTWGNNLVTKEIYYEGNKGLNSAAFRQYSALEKIVFCGKITTSAKSEFYQCTSLREAILDGTVFTTLDLSEFFYQCSQLEIISLKNCSFAEGTYNTSNMFNGVRNVRKVYVQGCSQYAIDLWRSWLDSAGMTAAEIIIE